MFVQRSTFPVASSVTPIKSNAYKSISRQNRSGKIIPGSFVSVNLIQDRRNTFSLEFTSRDGDNFGLNSDITKSSNCLIRYDKKVNTSFSPLVVYVKDRITEKGEILVNQFYKQNENTSDIESSNQKTNLKIPEYWNSENTSRRIVDFSLSFFSSFKGSREQYLTKIKAAIEDGFKQAEKILGNLPEEITALTKETFDLVMEKLDSWFNSGTEEPKD